MDLQQHSRLLKTPNGVLYPLGLEYAIEIGINQLPIITQMYPDSEKVYYIHFVFPHHVGGGGPASSYDKLIEIIKREIVEDPAPYFAIRTSPPAWTPEDLPFRTYNAMIPRPISQEELTKIQKDLSTIFPEIRFEIK